MYRSQQLTPRGLSSGCSRGRRTPLEWAESEQTAHQSPVTLPTREAETHRFCRRQTWAAWHRLRPKWVLWRRRLPADSLHLPEAGRGTASSWRRGTLDYSDTAAPEAQRQTGLKPESDGTPHLLKLQEPFFSFSAVK